jgi:hypothetical protein
MSSILCKTADKLSVGFAIAPQTLLKIRETEREKDIF